MLLVYQQLTNYGDSAKKIRENKKLINFTKKENMLKDELEKALENAEGMFMLYVVPYPVGQYTVYIDICRPDIYKSWNLTFSEIWLPMKRLLLI